MAELIGIATWNYGEGSLAERIDRFAGMGFGAVSLSGRDARALCRRQTPDVEHAIRRHSLAVTFHTGFAPRGEPVQADPALADFRSFAAWHAGTGALRSVNYDAAKVKTQDGAWERQSGAMRRVLGEMLAISEGAGFSVGVEDWPLDAEQLVAVDDLRAYPHFGMLLDLGHLNIRVRKLGEPDAPFPIEIVQSHLECLPLPINELHVHNNDGRGDLHAPPTTGTADLVAVARLLAEKGVKCISTIEIVPAWCGLTEEQGLQAAREALVFWQDRKLA